MPDRVGQQLGNYRLLSLLGRGSVADVYLGEHQMSHVKVAVKVFHGFLQPENAPRFAQEARKLASLRHPHLVEVKEGMIEHGIPLLIMDFAPKGTIRQRYVPGQPVPLAVVILWVLQIAGAMQHIHDHHLVHGQVKPENVLVNGQGEVLLSDCGLAAFSSLLRAPAAKGTLGTRAYLAPEQSSGSALPASDQYALGVMVYEWLCGQLPFPGVPSENASGHLNRIPPLFIERGVAVAPEVEAVIGRALERDPQQRFASAQKFALALQSSSKNPAQQGADRTAGAASITRSPTRSPLGKTSPLPHSSSPTSPAPPQTPLVTPLPPPPALPLRVTQPAGRPPSAQMPPFPVYPPGPLLPVTPMPASPVLSAPSQKALPPLAGQKIYSWPLLLALVSAFLLVITGTGIAFTLLEPAGGSRPTATPEMILNHFCSGLKTASYQAAYQDYSTSLQNQVSFTQFVAFWSANSAQEYEIDRCDYPSLPAPEGQHILTPWSTHEFFSEHTTNYTVVLALQGNDGWKINRVTEAIPDANSLNTPEQVITGFCSDLGLSNYQAAYNRYSRQLKKNITFEDFEVYWSNNNKQFYQLDHCDHQPIPLPSGESATASWSTHEFYSGVVHHYRVNFVVEKSVWKIDNIVSI